nr:hypothetical protein [Tanacetum cinerariifolium]
MADRIKTQDLEIYGLKARVKLLEDKDKGSAEPSQEDAPIKRGYGDRKEVVVKRSTELGSNDTEEMVNVLSSMEDANILTSRVVAVSVSPVVAATTVGVSTVGVPTVNGLFPTVTAIFTTASVSNEMIAKHLQEYEQAAANLSVREKIELINELEQREFYMSVLRSHAGWKTKHFRGMTLEEIKEKFILVWKQLEDFVPMSSKEESVSKEELKEMMQLVPLEEVYVEALQVKHPIIDWEIHCEEQREYWKIIRLGGHTAVYQFFVDMLKQFDREDLHQLWILVKETLSIKQATKDKENELWVELKRIFEPDFKDQLWTHNQNFMHDPFEWIYNTCGVHYVFTKDQEIFMVVEKDYPLRKGLATVMICNMLQVEQYS